MFQQTAGHQCPHVPWVPGWYSRSPFWGCIALSNLGASDLFWETFWCSTSSCLIPFETEGPNDDDNHDQSIPVERVFRRDIFHNTKVGILRDFVGIFVGSVMWSCCCANWTTSMRRGSPMDVSKYCIVPTAIFNCFATLLDEALALVHLVPHFSMLLLGIASSSKGSDTSHLLAWIAVLTTGLLIDPISPGHLVLLRYIKNTAMSARTFLRLIYGHGLWLRRHCIAAVHQNIHVLSCPWTSSNSLGSLWSRSFTCWPIPKLTFTECFKTVILSTFWTCSFGGVEWMKTWSEKYVGCPGKFQRERLLKGRLNLIKLVLMKSKAWKSQSSSQSSKGLAWCEPSVLQQLRVLKDCSWWWLTVENAAILWWLSFKSTSHYVDLSNWYVWLFAEYSFKRFRLVLSQEMKRHFYMCRTWNGCFWWKELFFTEKNTIFGHSNQAQKLSIPRGCRYTCVHVASHTRPWCKPPNSFNTKECLLNIICQF